MNRVIVFIAAFIVAFFVAFPCSVSAEENEINLIEISSDVWSQMSATDKDTLFRYAINRCGGLTYGSTLELSDVYKLQYYNGMIHHLLHPEEDSDTSTFIALELLGIVDFKLGYFKTISSTVDETNSRPRNTIGFRPSGIYSGTLFDGSIWLLYLKQTTWNADLYMPYVQITHPDSTKEGFYCTGGFYPSEKKSYFKPEFYTAFQGSGAALYFKTPIFGYDQYGNLIDVSDWQAFIGYVSYNGEIELVEDDSIPSDPDNPQIVDPSIPDYGDDVYVNEELLDILNKIYDCEVQDLTDQHDLLSALMMINSTLENLDKNNTDNTELIAVLLAIQTLLDSLNNNNSNSSDYQEELDTLISNTNETNSLLGNISSTTDSIFSNVSQANILLQQITNNSTLTNSYLYQLVTVSSDTATVKNMYSSFQQQLFDSKFKFVSSLKDIIDSALSAYSSSSGSSIDFRYKFFSYSIDFNDFFGDSIDTVRFMLAAFIYVSFAFNTYRRIPSYFYNGGDR